MIRKLIPIALFVVALAVFAGSLLAFTTMTVQAQPAPRPQAAQGQPGMPMEELLTALKLNGSQSSSVRNTLDSERTSMRALEESVRAQRAAIVMETRRKLTAMLSAEQLKAYDEWREAHRPPPRPGEAPQNDAPRRNGANGKPPIQGQNQGARQ